MALALRLVSEAADAIEHAHQRGVVHCDLKPSNLLLGRDGHVRVSDFGLARSLAEGGLAVGGTAGFLAPEQVDPTRGAVSAATDVYGLGAVLYTLFAGRPPSGTLSVASPGERRVRVRDIPLRADQRALDTTDPMMVRCRV